MNGVMSMNLFGDALKLTRKGHNECQEGEASHS
jgi:hypothetical protein